MMKNAFQFTSRALFVFGHVREWLDKKAKVNFKVNDVTNWITNNYDTYIARYLHKQRQGDN